MSRPGTDSPAPRRSAFWREPFAQFLVLGGILAVAVRWFAPAAPPTSLQDGTSATIVVPASLTPDERRSFVREEVLFREALRAGLDQGDVVVRRRLVQKMRFRLGDLAVAPEPSDADLQAWLAAHPERFATELLVSGEHRFFHDESAARAALAGDAGELAGEGEPFVHGNRFRAADRDTLNKRFGATAAAAILGLAVDVPPRWSGPIRSTYGWHLVRLDARTASEAPQLDHVRDAVRADWLGARRADAREAAIRERIETYSVEIR